MAFYHREMTGVGQHVDVSMQDAVELTLMNAVEIFDILKKGETFNQERFVAALERLPKLPWEK